MRYTNEQIEQAVMSLYMQHGRAVTAADIADRLGCSAGTVTRRMGSASMPRLDHTSVMRPVYERNYNTYTRDRTVNAWLPSRQWLRDVVLALRKRSPTAGEGA